MDLFLGHRILFGQDVLPISYGPKAKIATNMVTTCNSEISTICCFNQCHLTLQSQKKASVDCTSWSPTVRVKVMLREQRLPGDLESRSKVTHNTISLSTCKSRDVTLPAYIEKNFDELMFAIGMSSRGESVSSNSSEN